VIFYLYYLFFIRKPNILMLTHYIPLYVISNLAVHYCIFL